MNEAEERLRQLGAAAHTTRTTLYTAVIEAVHAGMSESAAARAAGIDRMTVRRLLGKHRPAKEQTP